MSEVIALRPADHNYHAVCVIYMKLGSLKSCIIIRTYSLIACVSFHTRGLISKTMMGYS